MTDQRKKPLSHIHILLLEKTGLVAQDWMEVAVSRRANEWQPQILQRSQ